jgi:hypothetical protein
MHECSRMWRYEYLCDAHLHPPPPRALGLTIAVYRQFGIVSNNIQQWNKQVKTKLFIQIHYQTVSIQLQP